MLLAVKALVDVNLGLLDLGQIIVARIYLCPNRLYLGEHTPQTLQLAGERRVASHFFAFFFIRNLGSRVLRDA